MGTGGHSHQHSAGDRDMPPLNAAVARWLWPIVVVCGIATLLALIVMWPSSDDVFGDPLALDADPIAADVEVDDIVACSYAADVECRLIGFVMLDGPYEGDFGAMEQNIETSIRAGDEISVVAFESESGERVYSFYEFRRGGSMQVLLMLFVGAVLVLGRWRGLGALAGLGASLLIIVVFTLPAILNGSNALTVAIVTASVIAFIALFLAHGFEIATAVALVSTLASLVLTALLAWVFATTSNLTGLTDDSSFLLAGLRTGIDARGIVLAGIVIGALGVLDDVTVTQVSAVWELKRVQPELTLAGVMKPALRIGRDHISSTVNTLFLAYAGAALPLLLLFVEAGQSISNVVTREIVATELIRAMVGSIGLVASVPISTWLAALVVSEPSRCIVRSSSVAE